MKVDPDRQDLIRFREIGGVKYLMILVEEGVELNGVAVQYPLQESELATVL